MEQVEFTPLRFVFNSHPLTILEIDGVSYFIAREVGDVLGYDDNGRRLVTMITTEWTAELVEERHFIRLEGERLASLKNYIRNPDVVAPQTRHLILLTEAGLYRVLMLAGGPVACHFRDWLDSEVLPSLRRTGTYALPGASSAPPPAPLPDPSSLPKELLSVPAGVVLDLLAAEHALRRPLPALRGAVTEMGKNLETLQQLAEARKDHKTQLAQEQKDHDEDVTAMEAMISDLQAQVQAGARKEKALNNEVSRYVQTIQKYEPWYKTFKETYDALTPEEAARREVSRKLDLDAEREKAEIWRVARQSEVEAERLRQSQVSKRLTRLMIWFQATYGDMRYPAIRSLQHSVRLHMPQRKRAFELIKLCIVREDKLEESWVAELELELDFPMEQVGGAL